MESLSFIPVQSHHADFTLSFVSQGHFEFYSVIYPISSPSQVCFTSDFPIISLPCFSQGRGGWHNLSTSETNKCGRGLWAPTGHGIMGFEPSYQDFKGRRDPR